MAASRSKSGVRSCAAAIRGGSSRFGAAIAVSLIRAVDVPGDVAVDVPGRYLQDCRPGTLSGSRGTLMRVEPVGGTLGAVIHEVDLRALDDQTFDAIYE